jgi:hypothetical protein
MIKDKVNELKFIRNQIKELKKSEEIIQEEIVSPIRDAISRTHKYENDWAPSNIEVEFHAYYVKDKSYYTDDNLVVALHDREGGPYARIAIPFDRYDDLNEQDLRTLDERYENKREKELKENRKQNEKILYLQLKKKYEGDSK